MAEQIPMTHSTSVGAEGNDNTPQIGCETTGRRKTNTIGAESNTQQKQILAVTLFGAASLTTGVHRWGQSTQFFCIMSNPSLPCYLDGTPCHREFQFQFTNVQVK
jgi:hypothetical protein